MFALNGRRALVCGSTQGIGRACAELLAAQGASVTLAARDAAGLRTVLGQLEPARDPHGVIVADFADPENVRAAVVTELRQRGPFDILVNNTGGPAAGPVLDARAEQFLAAFQMHVLCNQALVQALVPGMKQRGYGRIINIISTSARQPIPGLGVSNTIRGAVASWAKTLAGELGPFGITVNNVLPGYTETARLWELIDGRAAAQKLSREQVGQQMKAAIPLGRFAQPFEIAAAIAFLASPAASYITGVSLPVDGGRIAGL